MRGHLSWQLYKAVPEHVHLSIIDQKKKIECEVLNLCFHTQLNLGLYQNQGRNKLIKSNEPFEFR